jgi:hypothetical protein
MKHPEITNQAVNRGLRVVDQVLRRGALPVGVLVLAHAIPNKEVNIKAVELASFACLSYGLYKATKEPGVTTDTVSGNILRGGFRALDHSSLPMFLTTGSILLANNLIK